VADLLSVLEAYEKAEPALAGQVAFLAAIEQAKEKAHLAFMQHDILNLISESLDGVQRAKTAVETLKEFSRVDTAEWQLANLEKGLESTLNIVWNEIKYKAKIKKDYAGIPDIECLAPQLNQVFLNLVINAAQAIDERGVIILRTGFDEHEVWVEVGDTGKGIEPEDMDKIFDPFFTTKRLAKEAASACHWPTTLFAAMAGDSRRAANRAKEACFASPCRATACSTTKISEPAANKRGS
jgi:two-component system NtrC family sensor kinase